MMAVDFGEDFTEIHQVGLGRRRREKKGHGDSFVLGPVEVLREVSRIRQGVMPGERTPIGLLSDPEANAFREVKVGYPGVLRTGGEIIDVPMSQFEMHVASGGDAD